MDNQKNDPFMNALLGKVDTETPGSAPTPEAVEEIAEEIGDDPVEVAPPGSIEKLKTAIVAGAEVAGDDPFVRISTFTRIATGPGLQMVAALQHRIVELENACLSAIITGNVAVVRPMVTSPKPTPGISPVSGVETSELTGVPETP